MLPYVNDVLAMVKFLITLPLVKFTVPSVPCNVKLIEFASDNPPVLIVNVAVFAPPVN